MRIETLEQAISMQASIVRFLSRNRIKDLVGDYGELLVHNALGGERQGAVNQGFDIAHAEFGRIEVKTRKYELKSDGSVRKEGRAVGFSGKESGFVWLAHVISDVDYSVIGGCLVSCADVWPEISRTTGKDGFNTSLRLPSCIDITLEIRRSQKELGFEESQDFK